MRGRNPFGSGRDNIVPVHPLRETSIKGRVVFKHEPVPDYSGPN